jgi:hypothetical protein
MKNQLNGATIQKQQQEYATKKEMLAEVERYELAARKFKAEYEMMEYAMKAHELKPTYREFAQKIMQEAQEAMAKMQENPDITVEEEQQDA